MKCFYHSADFDGHCSGAIIKHKYPECTMVGIDYGDDFPWDTIGVGEKVFMVDFSLQPYPEMRKLDIVSDPLIWIEHHKAAIEEHEEWLKAGNGSILGIQEIGKGACQLVWEYLHPDKPIPRAVKLLADYDVWKLDDPDTLPFQWGLRQYATEPKEQYLWCSLFEFQGLNPLDEIIKEGNIILNYVGSSNRRYCELNAVEIDLDGLHCIALNLGKPFINSQAFKSIWSRNTTYYDAMLGFVWKKNTWEVNLYTDKDNIDLSIIAKNRGGGGHKQAAGFQCKELPWK